MGKRKLVNIGDRVYCHSDGFYVDIHTRFCTKGKTYKILDVDSRVFMIFDDDDCHHEFPIEELLRCESKWFCINFKMLLIEKEGAIVNSLIEK